MKRKIYISPDDLPATSAGMNELQAAALAERKKLQQLFSISELGLLNLRVTDPRYEDELGRFHPVDAFYMSASTPFIGEVKIREYASTKFEDWMLQTSKIEALLHWRSEKCPKRAQDKLQIQIINFFADNVCLIWNLDCTNFVRYEKKFLFNMNSKGERNDREKDVVFLATNDALKIRMR